VTTLAIIAKEPMPGHVKTRLCPPCTPAQAAALAEAALRDTIAAATAVADKLAIILAGTPGPWAPPGARIVAQRGGGLDERLANGLADLGGPTLVAGMDTPQVTPAMLRRAVAELERHDAVLGPAEDGGYWCIGLRRPDLRALVGVPMSSDETLAAQRDRLRSLELDVVDVDTLVDVDTIADAAHVAALAPSTCFARTYRSIAAPTVVAA
jgi:rSAM/selenodomain-associated transferase 1